MSRDGRMAESGLALGDRAEKVAERVARALIQYIVDRGLQAGDSLPNEKEMSETFRVARGSLREALRLLETQGVIVIRPGPGGGPVVRELQPGDLVNSTSLILQVMRVHFGRVIDARRTLVPEITRAAARRRTVEQLGELRGYVDELEAAVGTSPDFWTAYRRTHETIAAMTGNEILEVIQATLLEISGPFEAHASPPARTARTLVRQHRGVLEAIELRDGEAAAELVAAHLDAHERYIARHRREDLDEPVRWTRR
ncbi:MAG: FCD domain-containing protein [Acidimicrobiia bacterium]|nr:FCD domain-containing protein [Acidimicrobiia bacterium]